MNKFNIQLCGVSSNMETKNDGMQGFPYLWKMVGVLPTSQKCDLTLTWKNPPVDSSHWIFIPPLINNFQFITQ